MSLLDDLCSPEQKQQPAVLDQDSLRAFIRSCKIGRTTEEISQHFNTHPEQVLLTIGKLRDDGWLVRLAGQHWLVDTAPAIGGRPVIYDSDKNNLFLFGFSSDQHLCSKYERLDVLNDLYDKFAEAGVTKVFNAGNWIDGECRVNRYDLLRYGLGDQCNYMAEHFPQRSGITTYSVHGDDHEGWLGKVAGLDVGKYAQNAMQQFGRSDWYDLGFMEAHIELRNATSGKSAYMLLMHPGGGSAYAHSYKPQKIVEAFSGGTKPAVLLIGHYHKLSYNVIRNVHAIQTGCTQDASPFIRKNSIEVHLGGGICRLRQDPATGAITSCAVEFFIYYDTGYYQNRWSKVGEVSKPPRVLS